MALCYQPVRPSVCAYMHAYWRACIIIIIIIIKGIYIAQVRKGHKWHYPTSLPSNSLVIDVVTRP